MRVVRADTPCKRARGLGGRASIPPDVALLIPRCRSVHTLTMRFALDLVWLDAAGVVLRVDRGVGRFRLRSCRRARGVLECRAGEAGRFVAGGVVAEPRWVPELPEL
jgi:uncharacterized membrane protein (UPF0127 family)